MVSVSIDPERDTPEALRAYARKLGVSTERWHFLTGEYESIKSLAQKGFKVGGLDSGLDHSNRIILVDAQGNIRGTYNGVDPSAVASLEEALKILLMPQS
jgi:protein SCO1/2